AFRATLVEVDVDHGRDDFAGLLDAHEVAHADVLARDLVAVVQRGARDGGAGQLHRGELGDGGEHAGAADLDADGEQLGFGALGGEFVGHGPARGLGGGAGLALQGERVEFDHRTVGRVGEGVATRVEFAHGVDHRVDAAGVPVFFHGGQTPV